MFPPKEEIIKEAFENVQNKLVQVEDKRKSSTPPEVSSIASKIDHTILALNATPEQIDQLCNEAKEYSFAAVCVRPEYVSRASSKLKDTTVKVATVISFHEGTAPTAAKVAEATKAYSEGAHELDVVLNRDVLKSGDLGSVWAELHALREKCDKAVFKLILETSQLSEEDVINTCIVAELAGWEFVKTSTGFCGRGASLGDVKIMKCVADVMEARREISEEERSYRAGRSKMKIKASGGVRSWVDAIKMVQAGADRIGTSSGIKIVTEGKAAIH